MTNIIYYESDRTDPYYNLAFEEYLFRTKKENEIIIFLWQNNNTIVIGKHQNLMEEVNMRYAVENDIHIVRRNSGGGAVYHDLGNLNYSVIMDLEKEKGFDILDFLNPLLDAISKLGIRAEISGRNDVTVNGSKVSGNSQYIAGNKALIHGTVLVNSNLQILNQVLTRSNKTIHSQATKSKKSKVENLQSFSKAQLSVKSFQELLKNSLLQGHECTYGKLSANAFADIERIQTEKYLTHKWNYGESPECDVTYQDRFEGGTLKARVILDGCTIKKILFEGDFFCNRDIRELEEKMVGIQLNEKLLEQLQAITIENYLLKITTMDMYNLLYKQI